MYDCDQCSESFTAFSAKANHVRWHHKEHAYSPVGLERIRANARLTAIKCHGQTSSTITEERTCHCTAKFTVTYREGRKDYVRKCCSRSCGAKRVFSAEVNAARRSTMKRIAKERPEMWMKGLRAVERRSSSKAERALAEALRPFGFKRHKHVIVDDITFDVDIVSADGHVWIESDGEWHFRQVHSGHNFEATRLRDKTEENEAIKRGVLLVRVNNQSTTVEEQVEYIQTSVQSWNGLGAVLRLGM